MAPEWAKANRPLVVIFTIVTFVVTVLFKADVNTQGGAYATGVLVLMGSAALAVTLAARREQRPYVGYLLLTVVFGYTTAVNIWEKPEGIKIASIFIVSIVADVAGLARHAIDRVARARRRRRRSGAPVPEGGRGEADPDHREPARRGRCLRSTSTSCARRGTRTTCRWTSGSCSSRSGPATCRRSATGWKSGASRWARHRILRTTSPAIPNAIAALLLYIRDETGKIPHAYFGWTEGNPIVYLLKFLAFGEGDTAPVTREVLRQSEPDPLRRPRIHVG